MLKLDHRRSKFSPDFLWIVLVLLQMMTGDFEAAPLRHRAPIQEWLDRLRSPDLWVRAEAAYAPPVHEPLTAQTEVLLNALSDDKAFVRRYVVSALGELAIPPERAIPPLVKSLYDRDYTVQQQAVAALSKIGSPAIPRLLKELQKDNSQRTTPDGDDLIIPILSRQGVGVIVPLLKEVRKQRTLLRGPVEHDVWRFPNLISDFEASALAVLYEIGRPTLPTLIENLDDESVFPFVASVLSVISPTQCLRDFLKNDLSQAQPEELHFVRSMIKRCKDDPAAYRSFAIESLRNSDPVIKRVALSAISNMDSPLPLAELVEALRDPDFRVRTEAVYVLGDNFMFADKPSQSLAKLLHSDAEAMKAVFDALGDQDDDEKRNLAHQVAPYIISTANFKEAIPELIKALHNEKTRSGVVVAILEAIGALCDGNEVAIKELENSDDIIALLSLIRIGRGTEEQLKRVGHMWTAEEWDSLREDSKAKLKSMLTHVLEDRSQVEDTRILALESLVTMRDRDYSVHAILQSVLQDPLRRVREVASRTLVSDGIKQGAWPVLLESIDPSDPI